MEIPASLFFLIWAVIGPISLYLGFHTLDKTDLPTSVSPLVMSFFKRFLQNSLLLSLLYGLIRGHQWNYELHTCGYIWTGFEVISAVIRRTGIWIGSSYIPWYFAIKMVWLYNLLHLLRNMKMATFRYPLIVLVIFPIPALLFPWYIHIILCMINLREARLASQMAMDSSLFLGRHMEDNLLKFELMFITLYVGALCYIIEPVRWARVESVVSSLVAKVKEKKFTKFFEFAVGTVGTLLFQNFFQLKSFSEVLAFLFLAVAWLSNLATLRATYDFGVFNFLVVNVVVGCTVTHFGLRGTTWLAYGAALLLYALRLKLDSLTLVHRPNQLPRVMLW